MINQNVSVGRKTLGKIQTLNSSQSKQGLHLVFV